MVRPLLVIVPALLLAACGGAPPQSPPTTAATTTTAAVTTAASTTTTAVTTTAATVVSPAPEPVKPAENAKTCTVPAVVGMVHQTAQDTMQASGLYVLLERDATGQGRLLINDRNWVTTAQQPGPGEVVNCGTTVTLTAKKADE